MSRPNRLDLLARIFCIPVFTLALLRCSALAELLGEILVLQSGTGEEANRGGLGCGGVLHLAVIQHSRHVMLATSRLPSLTQEGAQSLCLKAAAEDQLCHRSPQAHTAMISELVPLSQWLSSAHCQDTTQVFLSYRRHMSASFRTAAEA